MPIAISIQGYGLIVVDRNHNLLFEWHDPNYIGRIAGIDYSCNENCFYVAEMNSIQQIDRLGNLVWQYNTSKTIDLHSLQLLPNGNILVTCTAIDRVIEVNKKEGIVWEWFAGDHMQPPEGYDKRDISITADHWTHLNHAFRLPNGETLITLMKQGKLIIVDKDGYIIWKENGLGLNKPHAFLPYKKGFIVADTYNARVLQLTKYGEIERIIKHHSFETPLGISVKDDDSFLVADSSAGRVYEFNKNYEVTWMYKLQERISKIHNPNLFDAIYVEDETWDIVYSADEKSKIEEYLRQTGYIE